MMGGCMKTYAFLLLALFAINSHAEDEGTWMDANGCKVWNSNPKPSPGTTAEWIGPCDGSGVADGEGTLIWRYDGKTDKYLGMIVKGRQTGKGIYTWFDGGRYEGMFENGYMSGKGVQTWANGDHYEGMYVAGKMNGKGVYTWADGARYQGMHSVGYRSGFGRLELVDTTNINGWRRGGKGRWEGKRYILEGLWEVSDLTKECGAAVCDPDYDAYEGFDEKTKTDIVMSKITNAIKEERYKDALPHFAYLEKRNDDLPESFYFYQIKSLSKAGRQSEAMDKAKNYLKSYGAESKYYSEVIEILGH